MTQQQAEQRIDEAGFTVGDVEEEASEDVPRGSVIAQDPEPMSTLPPGDPIDLTVSTGPPDVVVPDIIGDDRDTARQKLSDAGLKAKLVKVKSDEEKDVVIDSDPRPATSVSKGTVVTVRYSAGPKEVPSVVGLKQRAARSTLEAAGFKVDVVNDSTTEAEKGTVLRQSPEAFTTQPQGTTVVITVSTFEEPSPTPTPTPSETPSQTPSESPTGPAESPSVPRPPERRSAVAGRPSGLRERQLCRAVVAGQLEAGGLVDLPAEAGGPDDLQVELDVAAVEHRGQHR